jgi:hypothetical protein
LSFNCGLLPLLTLEILPSLHLSSGLLLLADGYAKAGRDEFEHILVQKSCRETQLVGTRVRDDYHLEILKAQV